MASSVAGHRRAFGADTVPGCYEDLDEADLLVLVGSNAAWCHPVLFQRMLANKQKRGARMVVIDPRRTDTAEDADLFLRLEARHRHRAVLRAAGASRRQRRARSRLYRAPHLRLRRGAGAGAQHRRQRRRDRACDRACRSRRRRLLPDVPRTPRVVTLYSQGVNQSAQGTDKVNAILNCHLATGRIGKPGAVAVLADRPAQCDGRPRGRRPRQPARRAHGLHAAGHRPRAAVLEGAAHRHP